MPTYGPFAPAGWTASDFVNCSATNFDTFSASTYGGYVDDGDANANACGVRLAVDTTGMGSFTGATLVLTRAPSDYGSSGDSGIVSIRLEDTTSSAAFSSIDNPWGRTYRSAEVEYNFPNDTSQVTIDVSAIFADFYATYGSGDHVLTLLFACQQKGWTTAAVSWRDVCCSSGGTLPALTITGDAGVVSVPLPWVYA